MTAREEIGPWLGVVSSPRPRPAPGGVPLDGVRLALVDRLLREGGRGVVAWLAAWEDAVGQAVDATVKAIHQAATEAAARSLAPERVMRSAQPDPDDVRMIQARLGSTGIPLEALAARGEGVDVPLSRLGGALEEAWLELERMVAATVQEWLPRARLVAAWRRPQAPLWIGTAALLSLAIVTGLMLGGYLPSPGWFKPFTNWWWSLPWP
ncbi:MAG: hypothetical protein ABR551_09000 [Gemmatimonadales bacterium]